MKNTEMILKFLPEICLIIDEIEKYLKSDNKNINNNLNSQILEVYHKFKNLFGELPNDLILFDKIDNKNVYSWKNIILSYILNESIKFFQSIYYNPNEIFNQLKSSDIKYFLKTLDKINVDTDIKSLLYIFLSELCRTSDPVLSFNLIIKAFEIKNDLGKILGINHLKNYIYNPEIISTHKKIEKCIICGADGIPFHNSPSYKMINYTQDFLPSKLWLKCTKCENLYTQYFPFKFFERKNELKIIKPNLEEILNINQVSTHLLSNWCNILQNLKQYTNGREILEIGIGNGALIATALEMEYKIDCIEIEMESAQKISNLLNQNIICCDFLDLPENKTYDIISMGDVIEHLYDPKKGLEKVYKLLKNNGILWISTPNYNSSFNMLHKTKTAMWNEPWHITYFHKKGLEFLLNNLGFKILDYRISTHYNGSMEIIANKS